MMETRFLPLRLAAVSSIVWAGCQLGLASMASAQQPVPLTEPAPPAAEAPAGPTALTTPAMTGPLVANPNPIVALEEDPFGGKIYVGGAVTGLGLFQTNHIIGDRAVHGDASNAQVFFQKIEGLFGSV